MSIYIYIYMYTPFFFETYFDFNRYSIIHVSVLMLNILDHLREVPPSPNQAPYDWYDLHVAWSILCFSVLLESCQRLNKHLVIAPNDWYQPGLVWMNILHKYMYLYIYFLLLERFQYVYLWEVNLLYHWHNIELTFVVVIWTSLEIVSDVI